MGVVPAEYEKAIYCINRMFCLSMTKVYSSDMSKV